MKPAITLVCLAITLACTAQNYTRDAGIRIGTLPGISYRQYLSEIKSIEAQTVFGRDAIRLRVLKQFSRPALLELSDNITFTYGYGAHAGISFYSSYKFLTRNYYLNSRRIGPVIGLDAYLSLELNIREYPLIVGINAIPFFEFSTNRIFYVFLDDTAISIKYKF
ncbi:MAG: hypothetical protein JW723_04265 [Bacteroidales bacterium]|nr:hypothetical protein [Bacteroidales bacterium]